MSSQTEQGQIVVQYGDGHREYRDYIDPLIAEYRDNPLIEALPPIMTGTEASKALTRKIPYSGEDRRLPPELRLHRIGLAERFFQPMAEHLHMEQQFSRMIRSGYIDRNPLGPGFWQKADQDVQQVGSHLQLSHPARSQTRGFSIFGISGIGKSRCVESILGTYPQVIFHHQYHSRPFQHTQLLWLRVDCPNNGSTRALCSKFFEAVDDVLGTEYRKSYVSKRSTENDLLAAMTRLCRNLSLGVLVNDEIQNLNQANSGGAGELINFFVELDNTIGLPVVNIGTYKAFHLFSTALREARRACGQGDKVWDRMAEGDLQKDPHSAWVLLVKSFWDYQYLSQPVDLTSSLSHALYEVSQGITAFAVKAFLLAQIRAVATRTETITEALIYSVAQDEFRIANKILTALRNEDKATLEQIDDVKTIPLDVRIQQALETLNGVPIPVSLLELSSEQENSQGDTSVATAPVPATAEPATPPMPQPAQTEQTDKKSATKPSKRKTADKKSVAASVKSGLLKTTTKRGKQQTNAYEDLKNAGHIGSPLDVAGLT